MGIKKVKVYIMTCDKCGKNLYPENDMIYHENSETLKDVAYESQWEQTPGMWEGKWYCPDCCNKLFKNYNKGKMSKTLNLVLTEPVAHDVLTSLETEYGRLTQIIISPEYRKLKNSPSYDDYKWHEEKAERLEKVIKTIKQWQDENNKTLDSKR